MFRAVLWTQWKWSRDVLLIFTAAAAAVPVYGVGFMTGQVLTEMDIRDILSRMELSGILFGFLAFFIGALMAGGAWNGDSEGKYVYAMSLPVPRWHFVLLRFGAGALLVVGASVVVWLAALITTSVAPIPSQLHAYPTALGVRFLLAALLGYSLIFALLVKGKGPVMILLGVLAVALTIAIMLESERVEAARPFVDLMIGSRGIFGVFYGSWMLIDV